MPTAESVKYNFLIEILMQNGINTLVTGNSGVGKSIIIKEFLQKMDS